jgi:hypothetical protein
MKRNEEITKHTWPEKTPVFIDDLVIIEQYLTKLLGSEDIVKVRPSLYSEKFTTGFYFQIVLRTKAKMAKHDSYIIGEGGEHNGTPGQVQVGIDLYPSQLVNFVLNSKLKFYTKEPSVMLVSEKVDTSLLNILLNFEEEKIPTEIFYDDTSVQQRMPRAMREYWVNNAKSIPTLKLMLEVYRDLQKLRINHYSD